MVGFIGDQHLLSSDGLGVFAEADYSSTTLSNGKVVTAYLASSSGYLTLSLYNPKNGETTILGTNGSITEGYKLPKVFALDAGKFSVVLEEDATETNHNQISLMTFNSGGTQTGSTKVLDSGYLMEFQNAAHTDEGYFVTYRDRAPDAELQYVGRFFSPAGKLLHTYDFDAGRATSDFPRANPNLTILENGNMVAVWEKSDSDGVYGQIFNAKGKALGEQFKVSEDASTYRFAQDPELVATPDGGFLTVYTRQAIYPNTEDPDVVYIQKFNKNGVQKGAPTSFDSKVDGLSIAPREFSLGLTKDGLILVSFTGYGIKTGYSTDSNVLLAVLSPSGKLVFGPTVVHADDKTQPQSHSAFVNLPDDKVMLTLYDETYVQFSYQDSIQGVDITTPDYFWEGNNKANVKSGTTGEDILLGLGGADKLSGSKGADYIKGGNGNDTLSGGDGGDLLFGEDGDDTLKGDAGSDTLYGGQGNDMLNGGGGKDVLYGGVGTDKLAGDASNDLLFGGDGLDRLNGGGGKDELHGGADRDILTGSGGSDTLYGDTGNDKLIGGAGNDYVYGGDDKDLLKGGGGDDFLQGGDGNDKVYGDSGNDQIYSGAGNDKEYGGAGNDYIYDSDGNDRLYGGDGADSFVFQDTDFGKDKILDFEYGIDTLDMGYTAYGLQSAGKPAIRIIDTDAGVLFKVDNDHSVLVVNADLSDFKAGDYITDSPF